MIQELTQNYSHLFEAELINEINQVGTFKEVSEGDKLIEIGQYVRSMPLLVSGAIKILREDNDGDEDMTNIGETEDLTVPSLSTTQKPPDSFATHSCNMCSRILLLCEILRSGFGK